jgi:hypothetical protein
MNEVTEDRLGNNNRGQACNHMQRRVCHPENANKPDMFANSAAPKFDKSKHGFAATHAAWLRRLQLRTALIAKHRFSSGSH